MNQPMHILISAGEPSGDMHASAVIRSLRALHPEMRISAVAGEAMRQAGCEVVEDMQSLNVMGLGDVIKALPRIRRVEKGLLDWAAEERPDVVILVDFPGFHLRIGKKLRALGIPVIHYIAPKLWAWGAWRVKKLKASQDKLASILPFETDWFAQRGIEASYVGNPSAYACRAGWSNAELKARLGLPADCTLLALLPGSRPGELARHAPLLAEVLAELRPSMPELEVVVTRAPGITDEQLRPLLDAGVHCLSRMEEGYALRADAAVAVSGTATLELALWDVPTVLVYKNSASMIWLARKLVSLNCAGLANILLGDREVMPELIHEHATVENIVAHLSPLLKDSAEAAGQRSEFEHLRNLLGEQNPADGVAAMAVELIR